MDLIHHARRWADKGRDYLPTLACSACGKACMPLCGLGLNRKTTPMEFKDVVVKSRKSMLETGRTLRPVQLQFVTGTDIVIMYEKAMDCIEERNVADHGKQWVFTKPIPTMAGLFCADCAVCTLCGMSTKDTVPYQGRRVKMCAACVDACDVCGQARIKHHPCCEGVGKKYFE